MDLLEDNSLLYDFRQSPRTLFFTLTMVHPVEAWDGKEGALESQPDPAQAILRRVIVGRAQLAKDSLAVLAPDIVAVSEVEAVIRPYVDTDDLRSELSSGFPSPTRALSSLAEGVEGDDGSRLVQFMRNEYERFDTQPPTLWLFFSKGDWEIGNKDEWYLHAQVPLAVFDRLWEAIHARRCSHLQLFAELAPTLVDNNYAPPSQPVIVGVLRMGKHNGGSSYGYVSHIDWRSSAPTLCERASDTSSLEDDRDLEDDPDVDDLSDSELQAPVLTHALVGRLQDTLASIDRGLWSMASAVRWMGGGLVFLALVVMFRGCRA